VNHLLISFFSLISVVVFVSLFLFFYLRSVRGEIREYWIEILGITRRRLDKIPFLAETVKPHMDVQPQINEILRRRSESWQINEATMHKINIELEIMDIIHKLWAGAQKHKDLAHSTDFLYIKGEFKSLGEELEKVTEVYNNKVRHYNKLHDFALMAPFVNVFKYGKLPIFEFEP
jgi:hypothetical protein